MEHSFGRFEASINATPTSDPFYFEVCWFDKLSLAWSNLIG